LHLIKKQDHSTYGTTTGHQSLTHPVLNMTTRVNISERNAVNGKESVKSDFKMVLCIKAKQPIKDTMVKVDLPTQMETFTKVTGLMEKPMVMDALLKFMTGLFMMENGTWMLCMDKESSNGISENANTKEILKMDKEQEMEFTKRELKHTLDK
jgi:hypothetical protein